MQKLTLNQLVTQLKGGVPATPTDIAYDSTLYGAEWQCVCTLGIVDHQQFAGELAQSKADAEENAALQAVNFLTAQIMQLNAAGAMQAATSQGGFGNSSATETKDSNGSGSWSGGGSWDNDWKKKDSWDGWESKKPRKSVACQFFVNGGTSKCNKGDQCPFSHDPDIIKQAVADGTLKVTVCRYFGSGTCGKGDLCPFSHDLELIKQAVEKGEIFIKGGDKGEGKGCDVKGKGRLPTKLVACKFLMQGVCAKGDDCVFSHDVDVLLAAAAENPELMMGGKGGKGGKDGGKNKGVCSWFLKGECWNGANCKMSHDVEGTGLTPMDSGKADGGKGGWGKSGKDYGGKDWGGPFGGGKGKGKGKGGGKFEDIMSAVMDLINMA